MQRAGAKVLSDPSQEPLIFEVTESPRATMRNPKPEGERKRPWWHWALGIFVGLIVIAAIFGEDPEEEEQAAGPTATATATGTATSTPTPTPPPAEVRREALAAVQADEFNEAVALAAALSRDDRNRIRRAISARLARSSRDALAGGSRARARQLLNQAGDYPSTPAFVRASDALQAADDEVVRLREAARLRREARRIARQQASEAAQAPPPAPKPEAPSAPSGNCSDIAATDFPVPPGDPRDADGDGVACES